MPHRRHSPYELTPIEKNYLEVSRGGGGNDVHFVPTSGGDGTAIRALVGGGLLVFLATRLQLESQLAEGYRFTLYVAAFGFGAAQLNLSSEVALGYFTTLALCIGLCMLAASWATWPWFVWAGIWIGLSAATGFVFHRYPMAVKATVGLAVLATVAFFVLIGIGLWMEANR